MLSSLRASIALLLLGLAGSAAASEGGLAEAPLLLHVPGVAAHVTYTWVVMAVLIVTGYVAGRSAAIVPSGVSHFYEVVLEGVLNFTEGMLGEEALRFFPLIATFALFIVTGNLIGLIPGFESPTANLNTTVALAVVAVVYSEVVGLRTHGPGYIKHFTGPLWWLAPLMLPIEIISHLARMMSLSLRLFGNIRGEDILLAVLLGLVPYLVPVPIMLLAVFTSFLQGFIFVVLTLIYIQGALEHAH
jgi:F-type H+-transporting ATPase subunit a